jgi:hypothetical protein
MNKNTARCGLSIEVSIMLWRNAQRRLSSSLKTTPLAVQFGSFSFSVIGGDVFPSYLTGCDAGDRGLPGCETPMSFNDIGDLINESQTVITDKGSKGLSIKGHYSKKNGIAACLFAAEAVTARGAGLSEPASVLAS